MPKLPIKKIKTLPAVVYLSRNRLGIYSTQGLFFKEIGPELVTNLDVVKSSELETAVNDFLKTSNILPTKFLFIAASDICFEKDYEGDNCDAQREDINKYIETIPFDYVRWKAFRVGKTCKVVAVNREYYETISGVMEKMGFTLEALVPQSLTGIDLSAGLDENTGKQLLAKMESLRSSVSLFESYTFVAGKKKEEQLTSQKRTPVLLIVFIVLIIFLVGIVVITRPFSSASSKKVVPTENPPEFQSHSVPVEAPSITPVPVASISSTLKVQILNGSRIVGQGDTVKKLLVPLGLNNFEVKNSPEQNKGKTNVTFSSKVPAESRQRILEVLTPTLGSIFAQEGEVTGFDVVITTGVSPSPTPTN